MATAAAPRTIPVAALDDDAQLISMIEQARHEAGLSRRQLAMRAGLDASVMYQLTSGRRRPTLDVVRRLMDAAGVEFECQDRTVFEFSFATPNHHWAARYSWTDIVTAVGTIVLVILTVLLVIDAQVRG